MRGNITFFNFGRNNRLNLTRVVSDEDYETQVSWWLNGRILGYYINAAIPWRKKLGEGR